MIRKFFNIALIVALVVTAVFAQQPSASTPSLDRLRQTIEYLASDALEGRRTGTPGANDAAHYIAGEFNRFGLRPGMQMARPARMRGENQARYLQPFPYVSGVELGKNNALRITSLSTKQQLKAPFNLRISEQWLPLGFSSNGKIEGASAVFVGYGITDSALRYDDYANEDAKDKVVVAFEGRPDGDNPHGQFARFEDARFKAITAREHGAKALILVAHEDTFTEDRLARLRYDNNGDAGLPVVVLSRASAAPLLTDANLTELRDFEKRISSISLARLAPPTNEQQLETIVFATKFSISVDLVRRESPSFNVVGILPGSDPRLKDETIAIGAHYDHLGRGGEGSLAPREGEIHHGADDNASGVAGLLELARIFSSQRPRRTIVFIAFSGEEEGLIGSNYYVNHPVVPLANTVAMINMDMIGRLKENSLIIGGVGTAQEWHPMIERGGSFASGKTRLIFSEDPAKQWALTLNEDGYGPSDHSSFYAKKIPVLFFWTGNHEDYHKPSDTADKINYEGEARIVSFIANVIRDIDKSDKRPTYTVAKSESQGRTMGFRVYLGTIPNYADSNDGLKLDGVRDDSPAAKAGLKAGDRVVKLAGREVKNVYDYTYALGEMKAGQEYEVEIMRGSERLTLKIVPEARK